MFAGQEHVRDAFSQTDGTGDIGYETSRCEEVLESTNDGIRMAVWCAVERT